MPASTARSNGYGQDVKTSLIPPFATLLAPFATAQSKLQVGPGGYADIQATIDAATPGDVVVVAPGTYPSIGLHKGLPIRAPSVPT